MPPPVPPRLEAMVPGLKGLILFAAARGDTDGEIAEMLKTTTAEIDAILTEGEGTHRIRPYDGGITTADQSNQQQGMNVMNTFFYGENLDNLRNEIPGESVDLIYLDPPFNSNRNYNVLFREKSGQDSPAQTRAFTDTWTWDEAARDAYTELTQDGPHNVATMIASLRESVGSLLGRTT